MEAKILNTRIAIVTAGHRHNEETPLLKDTQNIDLSELGKISITSFDNMAQMGEVPSVAPDLPRNEVVYNCDDAFAHAGFSWFSWRIIVINTLVWVNYNITLFAPPIVAPLVKVAMGLTNVQTTLLASMPYAGYLFGHIPFGTIGDRFGRKRAVVIGGSLSTFLLCLSVIARNYHALLVFGFLGGLVLPGSRLCWSHAVELLPPNKRSYVMILVSGTVIAAGILSLVTWLFMGNPDNWLWTVGLGQLGPFAVITPLYFLSVPESPRFELMKGKGTEVKVFFERLWKKAGVKPLQGKLETLGSVVVPNTLKAPFSKTFRVTTAMFMFVWFSHGWYYYGSQFLIPGIRRTCLGGGSWMNATNSVDPLTARDLQDLFVTSLGELPIIPISMILVNTIGRPKTVALNFFLIAVSVVPLWFCQIEAYSWISLWLMRAASAGNDGVLDLFMAEMYPTYFRNTAVSVILVVESAGMIATPYIINMLLFWNSQVALGLLLVMPIITTFVAFLFPHDTSDTKLTDAE